MECWKSQLDITKMATALIVFFPTSIALDLLACNTEPSIKGSIRSDSTISVEIVESSVAYFQHSVVYNILLGSLQLDQLYSCKHEPSALTALQI